ncbi:probable protein phosphatase 2C 20 [Phragmites australis]|uniref:probable protein phosphatase 2C 20 n=1 Tax=Phragmites australis TaxID=29695 RepID=UPI002D78FB40|nr:probable protein phosphatase 2C 20 [Phragmites australis]
MGASNSRPVTTKFTEGGENDRIRYAASTMQGWRKNMEDASAVVPDLDHLTSFFGVYDGHGGLILISLWLEIPNPPPPPVCFWWVVGEPPSPAEMEVAIHPPPLLPALLRLPGTPDVALHLLEWDPVVSPIAVSPGVEVALLCARQFHNELLNHPDYETNVTNALESAFLRMDELLKQSEEWRELLYPRGNNLIQFLRTGVCANHWPFPQAPPYVPPKLTGSTACVAVIRGDQIIVGNVGDSRCVVSRNGQAIALSTDHKPLNRDEKLRIQKAGGRVIRDTRLVLVRGRLSTQRSGIPRVQGMLAMSRAIGDFEFKQNTALTPAEQMVTCTPDLINFEITEDTEFLVIASDGIWDCMTNQGVVDFVRENLRSGMTDLRVICERLVDRGLPSADNATAILVQFKNSRRLPPLTEDDGEDKEKDGDVDNALGTAANEQQPRAPAPETTEEQTLLSDEI